MSNEGPRDPTELLRALADHISAMAAYWDSSLRCRFANRAYERWFGIAPEAIVGMHIRDLLGPLYEANRPHIEAALRGAPQEFEREIPNPAGGSPRHALAQYIPNVIDGEVRGFFVLVTDVSRLKRVEQALRESEARFSAIVSMSADAIVSIDARDRIVVFNEGAERAFGWSRDEVLGRPLDVLVPARFREVHARHVRDMAQGDRRVRPPGRAYEITGLRKDGTEFPAEATIAKVQMGERYLLTVSLRDITERKRIEDERRVYVALLESSSDFIGIADANGRPMYINPAGRRMVGLPEDVPVDRLRIPDFYAPEQRAFGANVILPTAREHGRWSGETALRHWKTEAVIPVSQEHLTIRDPATGRVLGMGTITRDISEARRHAEQREELLARERKANAQLREAEERFRLTLDEAPIGMAIVALDGRFVRVNRALCEIVGYEPEELTGLTFQAITHPEDLDADLALATQLIEGKIPRYQLGKRYIRKDGTVVDVTLSAAMVRRADGTPVHFIAQIEDVTQRKRAEAEQRLIAEVSATLTSSLDYEQTLAAVAELSVRSFADMCFVDIIEEPEHLRRLEVAARDPARRELCERVMAIPPDAMRSSIVPNVLDTRQPLLIPRPSDETIASFAKSEEHLQLLRAASIRSIVAVPLIAHGQLLGSLGFLSTTPGRIFDSADLRLAEDIAQRAANALENALLYRTAQRATQARDDVLGIVAHDLRSPLGVITMQASTLRRTERDRVAAGARSRTPADVIERAANRMNRLIQDLLDITRIDAKRLRIEPAQVTAERLVHDLVEAHLPVAAASSIDIRTEVAPDLPDVWADRDRLQQVLENLLGNALKFTPRGGVVTIGAARRAGEVLFWVKDTGSGIAVDDVPHVFDRFWQAGTGMRRGAGLGLPIVKGIVEAHRGVIWVESTLGRGTTFFFTLPTAQRVLAASPEPLRSHAP